MSLQQHLPDGGQRIRWVKDDGIAVNERVLRDSFVLSPEAVLEELPFGDIEAIDSVVIDRLIALQPALVLIGSGSRQRFLPPVLQARLLSRGIGVECMDNAAAARTFNLLADEARKLVAVFLINRA